MGASVLVAAPLSEKFGYKRLMSGSLLLASMIAIVVAFAPNFLGLLVFRALLGVSLAGLPSVAMAYVKKQFHPQDVGEVMGMYISGTSIGGMSGRIITGTLTSYLSWRPALFIDGVLSLMLTLWFWRNLPQDRHPSFAATDQSKPIHPLWQSLSDRGLMVLYVLPFLLMGSFVTVYNYFGYLLMGPPYYLNQAVIGWVFIVYLGGTISSTWMGRLTNRVPRIKVLMLGMGLMFTGLGLTMPQALSVKVAGLAILTFGFFGAHSVASSWVSYRSTYPSHAASLYLLSYYLGSSVVGTIGGFFWSDWGWLGVVSLVGVLLISAIGVTLFLPRTRRQFTTGGISPGERP